MTKTVSLKKMAKMILSANQYMTLGTVNASGEAWVSPVVYAFDDSYNLYFMSLPTSQHCKNISREPEVSVAVFDSHQNFGEGIGLQMSGEVSVVPIKDAVRVFRLYFGRKWPYGSLNNALEFKKIFKYYKYRFYKFCPGVVWMNDPTKKYDTRVKVRV